MGFISAFVYVETPVVNGIYQYRVHCGQYGCLYEGTSWEEAYRVIQGCLDDGLAAGCWFDGDHGAVGKPGLEDEKPQCGELTNIKAYLAADDD
jgi:hypothetical protein